MNYATTQDDQLLGTLTISAWLTGLRWLRNEGTQAAEKKVKVTVMHSVSLAEAKYRTQQHKDAAGTTIHYEYQWQADPVSL